MAYLLLWFATVWGILMSTKLTGKLISSPVTYGLHEFFPILATTMATFHAVILLGDSYIGFNFFHLLIPFTSPYQPFWTGLGVISLELCIVLIISLFVRKQIGYKTWRVFHYLAYIAFVMALFHGSMAGSDSQFTLMKLIYLMTGLSVLFLTYYRVFTLKLK
jgi:predicted ferric reductase